MNDRNYFTFTGRLTADPDVRSTNGGGKLTKFSVANQRSWREKNSEEWKSATSFFRCTCWGYLADRAAKLSKGEWAIFEGRIEIREYEDKKTGERKWSTDVNVSSILTPPKGKQAKESGLDASLGTNEPGFEEDFPLDMDLGDDGEDVDVPF